MPGFDEFAVLDADDGDAGDAGRFAGGFVAGGGGPAEAGEVAFGEGYAGSDLEIGEFGLEAVVEGGKFVGAADGLFAFMENGIGSEEFKDGFAAGLVPDFLKPAGDELLIQIESSDGVGGGHVVLQDWRCGNVTLSIAN